MKAKELFKACKEYPYILLRHRDGSVCGINTKTAFLKSVRGKLEKNPNVQTNYTGFWPCSFQEYISHKIPFTT